MSKTVYLYVEDLGDGSTAILYLKEKLEEPLNDKDR